VPTRIYSLAKDLNIDGKKLVELCTKAGIQGKGSALASLEDDEVVKLKAFLEGGAAKQAAAPANLVKTSDVLNRPVSGTVTLPPPPPPPQRAGPLRSKPAPTVEHAPPPVAAEHAPVVEAAPPTVAAKVQETELEDTVVSPAARAEAERGGVAVAEAPPKVRQTITVGNKRPPAAEMAPQRGDALSPRRGSGIRNLDTKAKKAGDEKRSEGDAPAKPGARRVSGPRFAEMPEVKQPAPTAKAEPKAQKPVIRLPSDVIKKSGSSPLHKITENLKKQHEAKLDADKKKGITGPGSTALKPGKKKGKGVGEEAEGLAGMADVRKTRKTKAKGDVRTPEEEEGGRRRPRRTLVRSKLHGSTAAPRKEKISIILPVTLRSFSEAAGIGAGQVLKALSGLGVAMPPNAMSFQIPNDMVELVAGELGLDLEFKQPESLEEKVLSRFQQEEAPEKLQPRPPIVTFLGHVDHGKTSLLDKIIGIDVVSGEAGGITQHIRAYNIVTKDGRHVAFVDTPGHEAFTEMRARGANVTDIAVLVVAADDGVMPQTEEALSHAKAAEVPIVVAMNKIDLPGADQQKVLQQLATAGLLPSEWGGDVEVIRTSAMTGAGMDDLLETLLVTAELHEYKANPNRDAMGTCLEAEQESGRGVIAKFMVQSGTLKDGDVVVCGAAHGRVKAMYDTLRPRVKVKEAGPSVPVNITGLDVAPQAGEKFYVLQDIIEARDLAAQRAGDTRQETLSGSSTKVSFEDFQQRLAEGKLAPEGEVATLNLIIRADVRGSIEAILNELGKLDHPEVKIKVLQASVGGITVADVTLAHASGAIVVGFNVIPDESARNLAEERKVEIRRYDIIYKVTDDIRAVLEGKLKPEERVIDVGRALVKQVFTISRVGSVAGCQVIQGSIERGCRIRVNRDSRTIGDYAMESLKREKDDAKEVARGMECGIKLANFNDIKEGDVLEAYKIEEVARTL
jgi:translation initiation factor IF-2